MQNHFDESNSHRMYDESHADLNFVERRKDKLRTGKMKRNYMVLNVTKLNFSILK